MIIVHEIAFFKQTYEIVHAFTPGFHFQIHQCILSTRYEAREPP